MFLHQVIEIKITSTPSCSQRFQKHFLNENNSSRISLKFVIYGSIISQHWSRWLVGAEQATGPWFNIKMSSYQYRKSHCGDKTVVRSSHLHNGISYTGKMSSLYWIGAQDVIWINEWWHIVYRCISVTSLRWNNTPISSCGVRWMNNYQLWICGIQSPLFMQYRSSTSPV